MRHLTADIIYPIETPPLENGIVTVADDGTILAVSPEGTYHKDDVAYYRGILCPGFVNTHCHLELSHLQNQIPPYVGLINFLKPIAQLRIQFDPATIQNAIAQAETQMLRNGIVAVGDISNDDTSFEQKRKGNLRYHTFVELLVPFGANLEARIAEKLKIGIQLQQDAPRSNDSTASLAPHAPYTVSPELLYQIDKYNQQHQLISSLHHQESDAENQMFLSGNGDFIDFYRSLNIDMEEHFTPPAIHSSQYVLNSWQKNNQNRVLLVHNTYSTAMDIDLMQQSNRPITWVFCPNANRYIENRLPNISIFRQKNAHIAIGTDSLTSNWQLCILSELKAITQYDPSIPLHELLQWATINGAQALGYDAELGSFKATKKPGIINISRIDIETRQISQDSAVKRII